MRHCVRAGECVEWGAPSTPTIDGCATGRLAFCNTCSSCTCLTAASTAHAHGEPWHTHSMNDANTFFAVHACILRVMWCGWEVCWGCDSAVSPLRKRGRTCSYFFCNTCFISSCKPPPLLPHSLPFAPTCVRGLRPGGTVGQLPQRCKPVRRQQQRAVRSGQGHQYHCQGANKRVSGVALSTSLAEKGWHANHSTNSSGLSGWFPPSTHQLLQLHASELGWLSSYYAS